MEATRASIEVAQARVGLSRAVRELKAARVLLTANWGSSTADFDRAVGELPEPTDPPALRQLRQGLAETPEVKGLDDLIEKTFEDGVPVFNKSWLERVPRDLV